MSIFCDHLTSCLIQLSPLPDSLMKKPAICSLLLFKNILKETWEEAGYNKWDLFIHMQSKYTYIRINVKKSPNLHHPV